MNETETIDILDALMESSALKLQGSLNRALQGDYWVITIAINAEDKTPRMGIVTIGMPEDAVSGVLIEALGHVVRRRPERSEGESE
jgi:hypothetical protein